MNKTWREMGTAAKIEAIKTAWKPGASASIIGAAIKGKPSRNAVIGFYVRYPTELVGFPLQKALRECGTSRRRPRSYKPIFPTVLLTPAKAKPLSDLEFTSERHIAGMPLRMLGSCQCRYAVNDAAKGETHLFCGAPSDGSWCDYHRARVFGRRAEQEQSEHKSLARAA